MLVTELLTIERKIERDTILNRIDEAFTLLSFYDEHYDDFDFGRYMSRFYEYLKKIIIFSPKPIRQYISYIIISTIREDDKSYYQIVKDLINVLFILYTDIQNNYLHIIYHQRKEK